VSNVLTTAREDLADALIALEFRVLKEVPQTFSPPVCWIEPRSPYRQPGQAFGRKRVYLTVVCLSGSGTNAKALETADELSSGIADAIELMNGFRLDPTEEIGVPGLYVSAQKQSFVGTPVNVIADVARA
jgi:hypothetical protein